MAIWKRNWLKSLTNKKARPASRQSGKLFVEELEKREMLSGTAPVGGYQGQPIPTPGLRASASQYSSPDGLGFTPQQIRTAYGFDQLPGSANFATDTTYDTLGQGQTIAIIDAYNDPNVISDLQAFDETFGINGTAGDSSNMSFFSVVNEFGGAGLPANDPGWATEISLDVEWAHAIAPGANIMLVEANTNYTDDLDTAIEYAARQPNVSVVSMSFAENEGPTDFVTDGVFTTPIGHQGVSFVESTGDYGAPQQYSATSPNVLAVGGTTLTLNADNTINTEVGWTRGSYGSDYYVSSTGGISYYEASPPYQADIQGDLTAEGYPSNGFRTNPDVAYDADPNTGFPIYNSYVNGASTPWSEEGGTSDAAPQWAGLVAIVNEGRANAKEPTLDGPSQLLPAIYQIRGNATTYANDFNDITSGYNGYNAGTGYDLVTGLGTPRVQNLVPDLISAYSTPAIPTTDSWTGAANDNNWNNPANWSLGTVPGPSNDVLIAMDNVTINTGPLGYDGFWSYAGGKSYNTIRSLTVTGENVTLYLGYGTLDLSGSGSVGTFTANASGDVVYLAGAVLKDAELTSGTTLTVTSADDYPYTYYGPISDWPEGGGNVLDAVTVDAGATLDMSQYYGAYAYVQHNLTLNGTILLGGSEYNSDAQLAMGYDDAYYIGWYDISPETISGTGSIQFGQNNYYTSTIWQYGPSTFTIGAGITVNAGTYGQIAPFFGNDGPIDLQGTIDQDTNGGYLYIGAPYGSAGFTNDGSIEVSNGATALLQGINWNNSVTGQITATGATLDLYGNWVNYGSIAVDPSTISLGSPFNGDPTNSYNIANYGWSNAATGTISIADGSTVNFGGVFTTDQFNNFPTQVGVTVNLPADTVNLTGSMDNTVSDNPGTAGVLALGSATGPLYLSGGLIFNGAIQTIGTNLIATQAGGTLDGVQLDGTFDMGEFYDANATVINGLTLNGTIELGGASGTDHYGYLYFGSYYDYTPQTISGTGTIEFGQSYNSSYLYNVSNYTLTFGQEITVDGGSYSNILNYYYYGSELVFDFQGTIEENTSGGTLTIDAFPGYWTSEGQITATDSTLNLYHSWTNYGTISVDPSTISLGSPTSGISPANTGYDYEYQWTNAGTITIGAGSTVYLGGFFTTDTYNSLVTGGSILPSDTVYLDGSMDNSAASNSLSGGVLTLNESTGPLYMDGGYIYQGTINTGSRVNDLVVYSYYYNVLDGVTLNGTLDMTQFPNTAADIINFAGLTDNGTIELASNALLTINGSAWTSYGTITATDSTLNLFGSWTNFGSISADPSTVSLGSPFNGDPTNPSNISIYAWSNGAGGTITIGDGSTVNFGGVFTTDQFYAFPSGPGISLALNQDTVNITGSMDNTAVDNTVSGGTFTVNSTTGPVYLLGGRIFQGIITTIGSDDLVATQAYSFFDPATDSDLVYNQIGTLDDVTLSAGSTLDMSQVYSAQVTVINNLVLNGTILLGGSSTYYAYLNIGQYDNAPETISGKGTIQFGNDYYNYIEGDSYGGVTFGPNLTIQGGTYSEIYSDYGPITNQSTIDGGDYFQIYSPNYAFTNQGTINNGYYLYIEVDYSTLDNQGLIQGGTYTTLYDNGYDYYTGGGYSLTNEGTIEGGSNGGYVQVYTSYGTISNAGMIESDTNLYVDDYDGASIDNTVTGTIQAGDSYSEVRSYNNAAISNEGTMEATVNGGVLNVESYYNVITNFSGGTLTGGTWAIANGGSLYLEGAPITTNAATIDVAGSGHIYSDYGATDALAGFNENTAAGSFNLGSGYNFTAPAGGFSNDGQVGIASGASFSTTGTDNYSQTGSTTVDGTLTAANVDLNAGYLYGTGTIVGNLNNTNGTVFPGDAPGTLTVQGNYTQGSTGVLNIEIDGDITGGPTPGLFGQLAVTGSVALDGTLNTTLGSGFTPIAADNYPIITGFSSISGNFASENLPNISPLNFVFNQTNGILYTVGTPVVTVTGGPFTYNGNQDAATVTVTGDVLDPSPSGTTVVTYSGNGYGPSTTPPTHAGTYNVSVAFTSTDPSFNSTTGGGTITIDTAQIDYTIKPDSHAYGSTDNLAADLPSTFSTGINGENLSIGSYASTTGNTTTAHVLGSPYAITGVVSDGTGLASDYTVTLTDGQLTVTPAKFSYPIANDHQTYGSPANLATDLGTTIPTNINGQNLDIAYSSMGDTATAAVGNYSITGILSDGTGRLSDYNVTLTPGTLTVNAAMSVVSAQTVKALQNISTASTLLATFTVQTGTTLTTSNFGVTIDWKDGSALDSTHYSLMISGTQVQVYGTHTYTTGGSYSAVLTLTYAGTTSIVANPAIHVGADVTSSVSMTTTAPTYYLGATNTTLGYYHDDYRSTVTIKNTSSSAIGGSLEILLSGLKTNSPNVTLQYATVTVGGTLYNLTISYDSAGDPYVYIPKSIVSSIAAGSSLVVSLWYAESASSFITYIPRLFSDPYDN